MKLLAVDLFAGIGGVTCGILKSGLFDVVSIERSNNNVINQGYSKIHHLNNPDQIFHNIYIQEWIDSGYPGLNDRQVELLHFSPPCQSFSKANLLGIENDNDLELARAIARIIGELQPTMITMEQVTEYFDSVSYQIILDCLKQYGYKVKPRQVNLSDYGHPQDRKRIFLTAHKSKRLMFQPKKGHKGWMSTLECYDRNAFLYHPMRNEFTRSRLEPFPTILRSYFVYENHKGVLIRRRSFWKYSANGETKIVPFGSLSLAAGFPKDFIFLYDCGCDFRGIKKECCIESKLALCNGAGIGNAFSPLFYSEFLSVNF